MWDALKMKPFLIGLAILLIALQYALWFSSGGIVQIWHLNHANVALKQDNAALIERNDILEAEVEDLKSGNEAIEERARNDLGMIKKGETFYQVVK